MGNTHDNYDGQIIAVASIFQTMMTVSFVVRLISLRLRRSKFGWEDFLLSIAFCAASLEIIAFAVGTRVFGVGHHVATLTTQQLIWFGKIFFASAFTHTSALAFAKLSYIILLHRIFIIHRFRIFLWITAVIVICWFIINILLQVFSCTPVQTHWNPNAAGHCGDQLKVQVSEPIPWIVTDFAVLVAPLPLIKRLHLPAAQRWGIAGLFLLGSITCVASCVRYSTVWYSASDVTYDIHYTTYWSIMEASFGVIVVSLIVSRPVFSRLFPTNFRNRLRSALTKLTPSFARNVSTKTLLFSFRRAPKDPPRLSTFADSDLRLAQRVQEDKEMADWSYDTNAMSARGGIEEYTPNV